MIESGIIAKFGGSILVKGSDYSKVAKHVAELTSKGFGVVVVVSAMKGITDTLLQLTRSPLQYRAVLQSIRERYEEALSDVCRDNCNSYANKLKDLLNELEHIVRAIGIISEVTPRIRDYVLSFGERLSAIVMCAALSAEGLPCEALSGFDAGIVTDDNFGEARPIHEISSRLTRAKILPLLRSGKVPVVTGFIGGTLDGAVTTLGRGGSDYTATLLAKYLGIKEVRLYTDVPGIMAADLRFVSSAKVVSVLSFKEAMELAYLGAKKFHPRTFEPLLGTDIIVRVTSLDAPNGGTVISEKGGPPPVKAVATLTDLALVSVEGAGMVGRLGAAAAVMQAASSAGVNIVGISQPVSEASITLVINRQNVASLTNALKRLSNDGFIRGINVIDNVAAAVVVGEGLRDPSILGEVFSRVVSKKLSLILWYVGDSSATFITKSRYVGEIVKELYQEVIA